MKKLFVLITSLLIVGSIYAQPTAYNAFGLSSYSLNGTANFISRAGALGAVGGDLSTASYNPAGLGLYNRDEISMSMGLNFASTESKDAFNSSDNRVNFEVGNAGILFYSRGEKKSVFKAFQFAFTINRTKSFGNRTIFARDNVNYSFVNSILDEDNGNDAFMNDFYRTRVVDFDTATQRYTSTFPNTPSSQLRSYTESGFVEEMGFSFSTNVLNKVYLGATVGVPLAEYHNDMQFEEEATNQSGTYNYLYNTTQDLYATGINLKVGAIYRPFNFLRLGLAIHTPTYYSIEDDFYSEVQCSGTSGGDWDPVDYSLQTPFRTIASAALILGNNKSLLKGTLSADYEYADYSNMKYHYNDNITLQKSINDIINDNYKGANTWRFGGELKIGSQLSLRAGYMNMSNPYSTKADQGDAWAISGGIGYNNKNFFIDFAYAYTQGSTKYTEYDYDVIKLDHHYSLGEITLGFRF